VSTAKKPTIEPTFRTKLRDLPRPEAIRIAIIKLGWDATTAAMWVDAEQDRYSAEEDLGANKRQSA
jgi:hypothetical protein